MRLRKEHIIKDYEVQDSNNKTKTELKINWDFWNKALKKYGHYHLFLDEIHNIVHSRQSMTKWNVMMSIWISQIRKILGDSEKTHIFLVSQRLKRIDTAFRDLLHKIIYCQKYQTKQLMRTAVYDNQGKLIYKMLPVTWVIQYHFLGENCNERYEQFRAGYKTYKYRTGFIANPYFQFYDSYQIFGETAYL